MVATPVVAPSLPGWDDVDVVPERLIEHLYRASEDAVVDIAARLSPQQRASLAVYCYRRSHLHAIGLAVAATCDQLALTQALGTALGSALFIQAQERNLARERTATGHRPKVTLAKSSTLRVAASNEAEIEDDDDVSQE
jgi:ferric-dicitrate binding protein FerR (iron transport regulator)